MGTSSSTNSIVPTLNSQTSGPKKSKSITSPCAISPVLLECPEQDCSKKYKHANGLKYHQSHAHGIISNADDDSMTAPDSPSQRSQSPLNAPRSCEKVPIDASFTQKLNFESGKVTVNSSESKHNSSAGNVNESPGTSSKVISIPAMTPGDHPLAASVGVENNSPIDSNSSNPFAEAISKPNNPGISTTSTPTKQEAQNKSEFLLIEQLRVLLLNLIIPAAKPNILRFANTSDIEQTSNDSMSDLQSQSSSFYSLQNPAKLTNLGKNKKSRKSPVPDQDSEICAISKSDGVRSPAYSDISDDSNTATENNLNGEFLIEITLKAVV